ncbi:MAG: DUF4129 domain-containing protein [Armatimonadota bacterium]
MQTGMSNLVPEQIAMQERVRRELADILARPEYNRSYETHPVDRAWRWLLDSLAALAERLARLFGFSMEGTGRVFSIIFACLVVFAFAALMALLIARLRRGAGPQEYEQESVSGGQYRLPSPGPLIKQAQESAQKGDYRGAFRWAYLATFSRLDEAGAVRMDRSRTNWEYLRELAGRGGERISRTLEPPTMDFDRKIYGGEPCTIDDYRKALAAYQAVSDEVAR